MPEPLPTASPPCASSGSVPALEARSLRHSFQQLEALRGVSFAVQRGEVVAVTGPSGSGKSTLLHLLGGLDVPQQGEVWWEGVRADTLDTQRRAELRGQKLGLVFQHHYLLEDLTVLQNVCVPALLVGQSGKERALHLLEAVGLAGRAAEFPQVLSGGERQRVALARSLMTRPAVVLADEPTGSLDQANSARVAQLLLTLAREEGTGVLLVTHDEALAGRADRVLHLLDGSLLD